MELSKTLIKKISKDPDYRIIIQYFLDIINSIDTVEGLDDLSFQQAGEQAQIRLKAKTALFRIIEPFLTYTDTNTVDKEKIEKIRKQFGL